MTPRILCRISADFRGTPHATVFGLKYRRSIKCGESPRYLPTTMKLVLGSFLLSLGAVAQAATHMVQVAPGGSLTYSPSSLTAAVGDTVEFQFESNVYLWISRLISESLCRAGCVLKSLSTTRWRCIRCDHI